MFSVPSLTSKAKDAALSKIDSILGSNITTGARGVATEALGEAKNVANKWFGVIFK